MNDETSSAGARLSAPGTDPFMKSLFGGVVAEGLVFPYPEPSRSEIDHVHVIIDGLRRCTSKLLDPRVLDHDGAVPSELLDALKELGAFGWSVPKAKGGSGLGATAHARVMQELMGIDASIGFRLAAHGALGVPVLLRFGEPELQDAWLSRAARGEAIFAFAFAETGAGSDANAIQTRADRHGDDYVLTGSKAWVINGDIADVFVVFARTSPAEDGAKPKLTAFLVPRGEGVVSGALEPTLGIRAAGVSHMKFDHVRVPASHVLGEPGRGFKVAMDGLTHARLSLASGCIGMSKRLLKMSVDRVSERRTFGRSISEFGLIRDKIARMTASLFALESMTYLTTGLADAGQEDFTVESAVCKVFGSETLWKIANEAQQIAGSLGYTKIEPYERLLRDARAPMVFEGTNEILRCFIALSGMQGPGRELEEVSRAMREPIKGFGLLSEFAIRKARSALGRERLSRAHPLVAREAAVLEEYASHLSKAVDKVLRRHGKNIAEMQYTQKRAANVAIDLYAIASLVTRTTRAIERRGEEGARREIDLTNVFVASAKKRLAEEMAAFDDNDDELRKAIAQKTCADGGYPLDVL